MEQRRREEEDERTEQLVTAMREGMMLEPADQVEGMMRIVEVLSCRMQILADHLCRLLQGKIAKENCLELARRK